ncbi:hypothetical protein BWI93_08010 [Siphonobacter sp. BAB-5385]|nr:hypothetical protein BWI93_08010 [Siphonobacter sp. BAB-5385]
MDVFRSRIKSRYNRHKTPTAKRVSPCLNVTLANRCASLRANKAFSIGDAEKEKCDVPFLSIRMIKQCLKQGNRGENQK